MNRPIRNRLILILICLATAVYYINPPDEKILLGLDLKGGTSYTLELDVSKMESYLRASALDKAVEILRKRVDRFGLSEPIIQPVGENRVVVQIPGLKDEDQVAARSQIQRVAYLELRLVHPKNVEELEKMKREGSGPPPGYQLMKLTEKKGSRARPTVELLVKIRPELTGKHLVRAAVYQDIGGYQVSFELDSKGGEMFREFTAGNIGNHLAIVLDKTLISAPTIESEIGAHGRITGQFSYQEAFELANSLENPLETPVKIVEERRVDPSLGADSIRSGVMAGIAGSVFVLGFVGIYYLRAGLIANVALFVNIVLLLGVLAIFKFTLTLPGVAGILLTIGMSVDANVLIYERIREELRKGKPLFAAIHAGYDRAFGTIMDSNVTTLITALVLAWLGKGPIQGFGVTLAAGICTSVFSAVVVTRMIFDYLLQQKLIEKLTMFSMIGQTSVDFLRLRWPAAILSGVIILAGVGVAWEKGSRIYGVDFTGGNALTLQFAQRQDVSNLRQALEKAGIPETFIQYQRESQGGESLFIKAPFGAGEKMEETLKQAFPESEFKQLKLDKVGGVVGNELKKAAWLGMAMASLGILLYITARFEFAYAVGAIIALLHDVLICLAFFFFFGYQLSLTSVGALLTVAGYSINDTIVVFDRIREEFKMRGEKFGFVNLINLSVNETLARTLLTSTSALVASLSLYIFGGGVIQDFAFILVVGIVAGTYSSVFIASPILLLWHPSQLAPQQEREGAGAQRQAG